MCGASNVRKRVQLPGECVSRFAALIWSGRWNRDRITAHQTGRSGRPIANISYVRGEIQITMDAGGRRRTTWGTPGDSQPRGPMVEAAGNWETASAINEWVSAPFLLPPRALTALLGLFRRGFRVAAGGEFAL
jgi:hypothetical protein